MQRLNLASIILRGSASQPGEREMNAMTRKIFSAFIFLIFVLLFLIPGLSGDLRPDTTLNQNTIVGRVTDPQGRSLAGLFVSARNPATGRTTYTLTQAQGSFRIPDLEAGDYDVKVADRGWKSQVQQVKLTSHDSSTVNLKVTADPVDASELTSAELLPLLPDGEGKQVLLSNCMSCHTLQKFVTGRWDMAGWRKIVSNMKKVFGASVPEGKDELLVDYLSQAFAANSSLQHAIETFHLSPVKPMDSHSPRASQQDILHLACRTPAAVRGYMEQHS